MNVESIKVLDICFALVYVEDLESALDFYKKYFNFSTKFTMDEGKSHYGSIGEVDLWIGSGYAKNTLSHSNVRASFMLTIDSVFGLFEKLVRDNQVVFQKEPLNMGKSQIAEETFWLQFADPSGNIIEVLGPR